MTPIGTICREEAVLAPHGNTASGAGGLYLRRAWVRIIESCGHTGLRFHDPRHAHATLMLVGRVRPKVVSERLGDCGVGIALDT